MRGPRALTRLGLTGQQRPSGWSAPSPFPFRKVLAVALRHTRAGLIPLALGVLFGQALTLLFAIPAVMVIFDLILKAAGVARITDGNLVRVLSDPLAVLLLLALVTIALAAVSLQLASVIVLANRQQAGQSLNIRSVVFDVVATLKSVLHYQSPLLMIYVFAIMPLGGFGLLSAITRDIGIPAFITGEMMKTPVSFLLYGALISVAFYLNVRLVFVYPVLIIERTTPWQAIKRSIAATRRQSWRVMALVGSIWIIAATTTALVVEAVSLMAGLTAQSTSASAATPIPSLAYAAGIVASCVLLNLAIVVIVQILTLLYRAGIGRPDAAYPEPAIRSTPQHRGSLTLRRPAGIVIGGILLSTVAATSLPAVPSAASADLMAGSTAVVAHRGFVGGGVENTISALEAAAKVDPDYVEMDVQQTKDGRFVLSHDVNLWLVSGRNVNTYELTLDEALDITLSVGGFSDKMVSMKEYVQRAEELGVTLLIELKIHGHESDDVVEKFLATLDSMGSTEKHIYHSLTGDVVQKLEAKRPELTVGRTVAISVGNVTKIAGDFLVVEQTFFTEELAAYAREENKQVFVWTVNDQDSIRDYLRVPVDGIITDQPDIALSERKKIEAEQGIAARLRDILHEFTVF